MDNTTPPNMGQKPMSNFAPLDPRDVKPVEVELQHVGREGIRYVHDVNGVTHTFEPGQTKKVKIPAPEADRMKDATDNGTHQNLVVAANYKKARGNQEPEMTREEINALERENLERARKANADKEQTGGDATGGGKQASSDNKLGRGDLEAMTKEQLVDYAKQQGIEGVTMSDTKDQMVSEILKAQRKA